MNNFQIWSQKTSKLVSQTPIQEALPGGICTGPPPWGHPVKWLLQMKHSLENKASLCQLNGVLCYGAQLDPQPTVPTPSRASLQKKKIHKAHNEGESGTSTVWTAPSGQGPGREHGSPTCWVSHKRGHAGCSWRWNWEYLWLSVNLALNPSSRNHLSVCLNPSET